MTTATQFPWGVVGALVAVTCFLLWLQARRARALIDTAAEARADELEIAQTRTAQLQRELTEARTTIRTQGDLLAQVSREVRGHMDGIIGSANLLLDSKLTAAQRQQLITLRAAGESLLYVLGDVQTICQAESGVASNDPLAFGLRAEIAHVFEVLAPRAALKGVEISLIIAPEVPRRLLGDVPLMRQFFFNVLASALRLAPAGSIILRVERTVGPSDWRTRDKQWLRFSVTDATQLQVALAEPSGSQNPFAGEAGRSALETGDNLALTVARRQSSLLGGRFGEAATSDRGPEFWFELPMEPAMGSGPVEVVPECFLVVFDDLSAARVAATNLFGEMGVKHALVDSAEDAIESLVDAVEDYKLPVYLLLDESVSTGDVAALNAAFRTQDTLKDVKVILLSLRPDKASPDPGLKVTAILQKPLLMPWEVIEAVDTARTSTSLPAPSTEPTLSNPPFPAIEPALTPRVLLVEDNEVSRQVCETMLKRMGCQVEVAVDGLEAVAHAKESSFDIIFMDCWMPRQDGYTASRHIRELLGDKAPPIIALTADDLQENRDRAEESGMCDFLVKPASRAEFTRVFTRWLKGKLPPGANASPPSS